MVVVSVPARGNILKAVLRVCWRSPLSSRVHIPTSLFCFCRNVARCVPLCGVYVVVHAWFLCKPELFFFFFYVYCVLSHSY